MSTLMMRWSLAAAALFAFAPCAPAGPLNPPPGPVQPTNRVHLSAQTITLPHAINQPGSYVLTSDIVGLPGQHGLIVNADDVTIDLNGFTLRGVTGSQDAVSVPLSRNNLKVINGEIRGWGGAGVNAINTRGARIERVQVVNNGLQGLNLGPGAVVMNCQADSNGLPSSSSGIVAGAGSVIEGTVANRNGFNGIAVNSGSTIVGCAASGNTFAGVLAIDSCVVKDTSSTNNAYGVYVQHDSVIESVSATGNAAWGVYVAGDGANINGCVVSANGGGALDNVSRAAPGMGGMNDPIELSPRPKPPRTGRGGAPIGARGPLRDVRGDLIGGVYIIGAATTVRGTTVMFNGGVGVYAVDVGSVVDRCTITANAFFGVVLESSGALTNSTVNFHPAEGVLVGDNSNIENNLIASNLVGVALVFGDNRVAGNRVVFNDIEIDPTGQFNLVAHNEMSDSVITNAGGPSNRVAPIVSTITATTGYWVNVAF